MEVAGDTLNHPDHVPASKISSTSALDIFAMSGCVPSLGSERRIHLGSSVI